jgi:hypothetical protein
VRALAVLKAGFPALLLPQTHIPAFRQCPPWPPLPPWPLFQAMVGCSVENYLLGQLSVSKVTNSQFYGGALEFHSLGSALGYSIVALVERNSSESGGIFGASLESQAPVLCMVNSRRQVIPSLTLSSPLCAAPRPCAPQELLQIQHAATHNCPYLCMLALNASI